MANITIQLRDGNRGYKNKITFTKKTTTMKKVAEISQAKTEKILNYIATNSGVTPKEISDYLRISQVWIYSGIKNLLKQNQIMECAVKQMGKRGDELIKRGYMLAD